MQSWIGIFHFAPELLWFTRAWISALFKSIRGCLAWVGERIEMTGHTVRLEGQRSHSLSPPVCTREWFLKRLLEMERNGVGYISPALIYGVRTHHSLVWVVRELPFTCYVSYKCTPVHRNVTLSSHQCTSTWWKSQTIYSNWIAFLCQQYFKR